MGLDRRDSIGSNVRFKDQNFIRNSFPNFELIRRKGKLCDVTLIVDQQKFSAHKIVLAATIPFFDAMFLSGMSEATKREITIQGIDPAAFEAFIIFAYTGEIQITPANVQATLIGASFLHVDSVRNLCCRYIEERLTLENLLQVRNFASSFLCFNLVLACDRIIHENFEHLITLCAFFDSLTGPEFCHLLESDDLQVSSEERVFHAIIAWCEHQSSFPSDTDDAKISRSLLSLETAAALDVTDAADLMSLSRTSRPPTLSAPSSRLKFLPQLLARVRLPLLSAKFIRDVVSKNPYIRADMACRDLLDEARDLLLMPDSLSTSTCSFVCRPRRGQEVVGVIYAVGGYSVDGDCQSIVEAYNPLVDRWEVVESMSTGRSRIAVVALKGCLYAIGGLDGSSRLNAVEKFDPKTGVWQQVASMNYRRSALGAAALNGRIYVCGGYDGVSSLRTCEVYNPDQNRWQVIPSMTECRSAGGVVALEDGRLFAVGGHNGLPIFASVECYHRRGHYNTPAPNATPFTSGGRRVWRQVAPMLHRRCRHGVAVLRGHIFAAGGFNGYKFLRSVEVYNPAAITATANINGEPNLGQWTEIAYLESPRSRVALAASGGRLYAIGGFDGVQSLSSVECFQSNCSSLRLQQIRLAEDEDGDDEDKVAVVLVEEGDEEAEGASNAAAHSSPSALDLQQHSHRRRGRFRGLRGRPLRHYKSRDNEDLEEWLEEGPRSLLVPFQAELTSAASAIPGTSVSNTANSDEGSMDVPTVTTEGLDSTESLIESLTFHSMGSTMEFVPQTAPPLPPPPSHPLSPAEASTSEEGIFADWRWLPAMPLIAHEGSVGVGVIPLY